MPFCSHQVNSNTSDFIESDSSTNTPKSTTHHPKHTITNQQPNPKDRGFFHQNQESTHLIMLHAQREKENIERECVYVCVVCESLLDLGDFGRHGDVVVCKQVSQCPVLCSQRIYGLLESHHLCTGQSTATKSPSKHTKHTCTLALVRIRTRTAAEMCKNQSNDEMR